MLMDPHLTYAGLHNKYKYLFVSVESVCVFLRGMMNVIARVHMPI